MLGRMIAIAASVVALIALSVAAPIASAQVNYSPEYWQLLDKYADREMQITDLGWWGPGFPRRGAYAEYHPAAPLPGSGEVEDGLYNEVWLLPDGKFILTGGWPGWVEDPSAPDGWSLYYWEGL